MSDFASTEPTLLVSELVLMKERDDLRQELREAIAESVYLKLQRDEAVAENARLRAAAEEVFGEIGLGIEDDCRVNGRAWVIAKLRAAFERRARGFGTTEGDKTTP